MIHLDVSLNTIVSGLIVAAIVGVMGLVVKTSVILAKLHGHFDAHVEEDTKVHERVLELERRAMLG